MRWDQLFDDLAGQLEHELHTEDADVRVEEERLRLGRLALRDRLTALKGSAHDLSAHVRICLRTSTAHRVRIVSVGRDWFAGDLLDVPTPTQVIIPLAAIDALLLTTQQAAISLETTAPRSELAERLGIAFLVRDLCRRRVTVSIETDAGVATGTIDRVGRDHLDLAEHDRDQVRRGSAVHRIRVVPFAQVLLVRL